jgi:hypothetical protein
MARSPVFIPSGSLVEITVRTRKGRKLLRPSSELNERVYGVLGRALSMFDVRMHDFIFMSNHVHLVARGGDAENTCGFAGYLNRNTSLAIKKLTGWDDDVWGHTSIVPILDEDAAISRLRYVLSNGVKEGLVASPLDWPGATGVHALLSGAPILAPWRPLTQRDPSPTDTVYPIEVAPLPCWASYPLLHRRRLLEDLIREVEDDAKAKRAGRPVLGVAALRAQNPLEETALDNDDATPIAYASSTLVLQQFRAERAAYIDEFKRTRAAREARATPLTPLFPEVPRT